jgi:AcrR family transcriptional regulator
MRDASKALFRDAILEAAEAEFDARGLRAARIQDIAERAGVAVGTVYNHFAQKEDLVRALMLRHLPRLAACLVQQPSDPPEASDWAGNFRARLGRVHDYVAEHRHFFRMACELDLLGPTGLRVDGGVVNPGLAVQAMIERGVAAGVIAGDPARLTRFFFGATRGLVEGALATGSPDLREEVALALDLFLRAAGVEAPRNHPSAQ